MNLFILNEDPIIAAQQQCDKHVVKMTLESGQMLSTAHRLLDGTEYFELNAKGRKLRRWRLDDEREIKHPCTEWTMESSANYYWHYDHFEALAKEFEYRFGKQHSTWVDLKDTLKYLPANMPLKNHQTPFRLAMGANPECMDNDNPVESYRNFYVTKRARFEMKWSKRVIPDWYQAKII
jgi:hypothetical protein